MEVKAFAGIDVGKAAHMCCIVDAVGNVLAGSFPFANDAEGFSKLLAELREVAKRSVGVPSKAESSVLKSVIREIRFLDSEIAATEEAIEAEMAESGDPTLGIRGVGPRLAAAIAAEVGDFSRFDDPDKLVSYAGLFGIGKTRVLKNNGCHV